MNNLTCILCKHYQFSPGCASDEDMSYPDERCDKGYWWLDDDMFLAVRRSIMLMASRCGDFKHFREDRND